MVAGIGAQALPVATPLRAGGAPDGHFARRVPRVQSARQIVGTRANEAGKHHMHGVLRREAMGDNVNRMRKGRRDWVSVHHRQERANRLYRQGRNDIVSALVDSLMAACVEYKADQREAKQRANGQPHRQAPSLPAGGALGGRVWHHAYSNRRDAIDEAPCTPGDWRAARHWRTV